MGETAQLITRDKLRFMSTNNLHAHDASAANNEIDLVRLLGELLDHRKFILILTALFTLVALLCALLPHRFIRPMR